MVDPKTIDQELSDLLPNEIIGASAGTGKTHALSNRYLVLLVSGVDCQTILATTFTKKGAGEILDRIVQRLSGAALSDAAAMKLTEELEFQVSRQHATKVLHELLKNLHRLEISTLDGFFNRVAKAFSLELGLPPVWELVDEQQIQMLRSEAVQAVLQFEELETLRHLMDKGESNRRIQSLLLETVDDLYEDFRNSNFDAWDQLGDANRWLTSTELETIKRDAEQRDYEKNKKAWEKFHQQLFAEDWAAMAESTLVQNVLDGNFKFGRSPLPEDGLEMIQQLIPHCRSWIIQRLQLRNLATRQLLRSFGIEFESAKSRLGQLFFDDISDRLKNFVKGGTTEQFSFRLDHQIQHLMLDEFQDTSPIQWSIIAPFAHQVTRDGEPGRSFFCVGDRKQAIYGWRGGVAEIFDVASKNLPNLKQADALVKSYRSSPVIIDFVNEMFGNLNRFSSDNDVINSAVGGWSDWFQTHETDRTDYPGHVTIEYAANCDDKLAKTNSNSKDTVRNQNVVDAVVDRVKHLIENIPSGSTIGVLTRTNKDVGAIIFALQSAGIAASEEGGNPLTDSAAVEMVLSAFQLADHPGDDIARYHISHGPLAELFDLNPESDSNRKENIKAVAAGSAMVRRLILEQGFGPAVEKMANLLAPQCTRRERLRLQHLVEMGYADPQDQQRWSLRARRFVEFVREKKVADASSAQVRVMTIHKAKGLEFDSVVLPMFKSGSVGLAGQPPKIVIDRDGPAEPAKMVTRHINQKHQKFLSAEIQEAFANEQRRRVREAMCLLYVAVTRAAHSLHIVVSCGVKPDGNTSGSVILATMTDNAEREQGVIYESGDTRWFDNLVRPERAASGEGTDLAKFYRGARVDRRKNAVHVGLQSRRGVSNIAPSALEGSDLVDLNDVLGSGEDKMAMERGLLLHACFEKVQWLDRAVPTEDELLAHLERTSVSSVLKRTAIKEFFNAIKKGSFPKLLDFQSYREQYLVQFSDARNRMEVFTERRIAASYPHAEPTAMIEGVVDRLVLVYENDLLVAADVIDFKSDAIGQHELAAKVAIYKPQLSAYRAAISASLGIPLTSIATRLAFISTGDVVNLDMIEATVDQTTELKPRSAQRSAPTAARENPKKATKRIVDQTSNADARPNKRVINQVSGDDGESPSAKQPRKSSRSKASQKSDPAQKTLWEQ